MRNNTSLNAAKAAKRDEFYTQVQDINAECQYYVEHFKDKTIYCNCDHPLKSNFFKYFQLHFHEFGIKKLIATCFISNENGLKAEINEEGNETLVELQSDGDFRNDECIEILKEADIVVTNPPFSLFRAYIKQMMEYDKKFLVIGNINAVKYRDIFPLIKDNKMWLGNNSGSMEFSLLDGTIRKFGNIEWFTNLDTNKKHKRLTLTKKYIPSLYPQYDNHDAINVDKTADIPMDYEGIMGVPISFLNKYCPEQFEIVGFRKGYDGKDLKIGTIYPYTRILIRHKNANVDAPRIVCSE